MVVQHLDLEEELLGVSMHVHDGVRDRRRSDREDRSRKMTDAGVEHPAIVACGRQCPACGCFTGIDRCLNRDKGL